MSEPTDAADEAYIAELLQQLRAADPNARCGAAAALSAFGPGAAGAITPLVDALRDEDEYVRCEAAISLGEIAGSCAGVVPDAERLLASGVPVLAALLDDPSEGVRGAAERALEQLGPDGRRELERASSSKAVVSFAAGRVSLDQQFCTMVTFDSTG